MSLDFEDYHRKFEENRGLPEILLLRMSNERNSQLFRSGTIQIHDALSQSEACATNFSNYFGNQTVSDFEHGRQCTIKDKTVSEKIAQ